MTSGMKHNVTKSDQSVLSTFASKLVLTTLEMTTAGSDNATSLAPMTNINQSSLPSSLVPTTRSLPSTTVTSLLTGMNDNDTIRTMTIPFFSSENPMLAPTTSNTNNWGPLGLVSIPIMTLLTNIFLLVAIKVDRSLHQMTYYFVSSMAIMHCFLAMTIMPPTIMENLGGKF